MGLNSTILVLAIYASYIYIRSVEDVLCRAITCIALGAVFKVGAICCR